MAHILSVVWCLAIPSYHTRAAPFQHNVRSRLLTQRTSISNRINTLPFIESLFREDSDQTNYQRYNSR